MLSLNYQKLQSKELRGWKAARTLAVYASVEEDQISSDYLNKLVITLMGNSIIRVKSKRGQLTGTYKISFIQSVLS